VRHRQLTERRWLSANPGRGEKRMHLLCYQAQGGGLGLHAARREGAQHQTVWRLTADRVVVFVVPEAMCELEAAASYCSHESSRRRKRYRFTHSLYFPLLTFSTNSFFPIILLSFLSISLLCMIFLTRMARIACFLAAFPL